jgi:hypothetical protein
VKALVLAAGVAAAVVASCQGPDAYHERADAGGTGTAGRHLTGPGGSGGAGSAAGAGGGTCTTCLVQVSYRCRGDDPGQASFVVDVTNNGDTPLALADLTLRYWYTAPAKKQELLCDTAQLGCTNLVTSANLPPAPQPRFQVLQPARLDANQYVEVAFGLGALALDPLLDTGEIQLRLHNKDGTALNQTDDYSFDCAMQGAAVPARKITAYVRGVQVWGVEPPLP